MPEVKLSALYGKDINLPLETAAPEVKRRAKRMFMKRREQQSYEDRQNFDDDPPSSKRLGFLRKPTA